MDYRNLTGQENMSKCLVTGGAGFIGSNLVDALIERGNEVVVIDNLLTGKRENINTKAKFIEADIRNLENIKPIFVGMDYVFHLAAWPRIQLSIKDPIKSNDINLNGTLNVLVAARDAKVKKFIYSASSSAYGRQLSLPWIETMPPNPISFYGLQKYVGEVYAKIFNEIYGLPTVCLRYFNIYGKRQPNEGAYCSVISTFLKQRQIGKPLTIVGDGEQTRDFTSVIDAVRANIMVAESQTVGHGELINIGRGRPYSVNEVADMIGGPKINIAPRFEVSGSYADNNLAKKLLGWEPTVNLPEWLEGYKKEMGI